MSEWRPNPQQLDEEQMTRNAFWGAGLLTAAGLVFFLVGLAIAEITSWQDYFLLGAPAMLFVLGLVGLYFLRQKRIILGTGIIFIANLVMPLIETLFQYDIGWPVFVYTLTSSALLIWRTLPRESRRWASVVGATSLVVIALIEFLDPPFRINPADELVTVIIVATAILSLAFVIQALRQAWWGNIRIKLVTSFTIVALLSGGVIAIALLLTASRTLDQTLGASFASLGQAQGLAVGDLIDRQLDVLGALSADENLADSVNSANQSYEGSLDEIRAKVESLDQEWREAVAADELAIPLVQSRVNWSPLSQRLRNYRDQFPDHIELFVTDRTGALVAATNVTSDYNQADEEWWQTAFNADRGGAYIGQPEYDESAGDYAINLAVQVRDPQTGILLGVLRSTYRLGALDTLLFSDKVEAGETDLVFPGEEVIALHEGGVEILDQETVAGLQSNSQAAYAELTYEGVPSLAAQAPVKSTANNPVIDGLGWFVVLHQPIDVAMAPVVAQTRLSVSLVLVVIGVVSAGALLLSQLISGPIVRLASVAEEVGGGNLAARATVETRDEIGALSQSFNAMADQLSVLVGTLEQRVAERTRAIELSADVSRRLSTILDPAQLVSEVVELLQFAFDYYHVHIYLFDEARENLIMAGGTGEAGKTMLERGHKIVKGRGLVGRTGESGRTMLVADTTEDPNWLPNPLLPETKSEIAVPILLGDEILGALDVQEDEVGGLDAQDADLLEGIAGQVAIALRNARQYAEAQRRAEREAQIGEIIGRIQSTQTVEQALQVAVRELGRALKTPKTQARVKLAEDENGNGRQQL